MTAKAWPRVRLGEVLREGSEAHRVEADRSYPNFGIYSFGRGLFPKPPISGTSTSARTLFRVRAGQFVYSRLFAFEGAYGVVTPLFDGHFVSNEYPIFDLVADRLNLGYLKWYLQRPIAWQEIARGSTGVGVRRQRIQPSAFLQHEIPLPPLAEQQRLVARIEEVAGRVAEARRLADGVDLDLEALLLSSFESLLARAAFRPLAEVAPLVRRAVAVSATAQYPEVGIRSFGRGTFHKPSLLGASLGSKRLFVIRAGDLLFSNVFAWEGAVAVAQAGDDGRYGSHRFISRVPNPDLASSEFLCFYFLTEQGLAKLGEASPGGAGRNRTLGLAALDAIEVPVPAIDAQHQFGKLLGARDRATANRTSSTTHLDALLPSLLDRAFRGEL